MVNFVLKSTSLTLKKPIVDRKIKQIILTSNRKRLFEDEKDENADTTDAIVLLDDNQRYVASFFSFRYIANYNLENAEYKRPLHGLYFWNKNMVLVKNCTLDVIRLVVKELMDEGNFQEAFRGL